MFCRGIQFFECNDESVRPIGSPYVSEETVEKSMSPAKMQFYEQVCHQTHICIRLLIQCHVKEAVLVMYTLSTVLKKSPLQPNVWPEHVLVTVIISNSIHIKCQFYMQADVMAHQRIRETEVNYTTHPTEHKHQMTMTITYISDDDEGFQGSRYLNEFDYYKAIFRTKHAHIIRNARWLCKQEMVERARKIFQAL